MGVRIMTMSGISTDLRSRITHILHHYEILEFKSSIMAIVWGMWVLAHADFATVQNPYVFLAKMLPPAVWGFLFMFGGGVQLAVLIWNNWHARRMTAAAAAISWTVVGVLFYFNAPYSTAVPIYGIFAAFQGWAYWRLNWDKPK